MTANLRGALWMIASALTFTLVTSLVKFLGTDYSASIQAFYRSAAGLLVLLPFIARDWRAAYVTHNLPGLVFRSASGTIALILSFYAYQHLPLAEANALSFTRTLWIALMAAVFLKESFGAARFAATILGFAGALLMLLPGGGSAEFSLATGAALAAAVLYAFTIVSLKFMTRDHSAFTLVVWGSTLGFVFSLPPALLTWRWPPVRDLSLLGFMGVIGVITQICYVKGMHIGEASVMAPIDYSRLVFAVLIGLIVFGEHPTTATVAGTCVIIVATLFIQWHERRDRPFQADM
jgi:drug/metabolite transporter (DMT)-like permease